MRRCDRWKVLQVSCSLIAEEERGVELGVQLLFGHEQASEALASCSALCGDLTFSLNSFIWPHQVSGTAGSKADAGPSLRAFWCSGGADRKQDN